MRGDPHTAVVYLDQALEWREKLKNVRGKAETYNWLGRAALCLGDTQAARGFLVKGLKYARQVDGIRETADILDSLTLIAQAQGEAERLIVLASASDLLRRGARLPRLPVLDRAHIEALENAHAQVSPDELRAATTNGSIARAERHSAELCLLVKILFSSATERS